jgi:hypothetical protein
VPTARAIATVALTDKRLDLFLQDLARKKPGDLRVMLEKLELHVDRLVE